MRTCTISYIKIMFLLLILLSVPNFAQARIGSTAKEIIKEFKHLGIKWRQTDSGERYLWYQDKLATVAYYFDYNSRCKLTVIIPNNQKILNWYCQKYNSEAVILSNTQWRLYTGNGVIDIELIYLHDGYYFRLE